MRRLVVISLLLAVGCYVKVDAPNPRIVPVAPLRKRIVEARVGTNVSPDGKEQLQCDYPVERHTKNVGGSDGAGLCVFTSMHHSGDWQEDALFEAMQRYMMKHPGGGWPEKVEAMLSAASKELGLPKPDYFQVEGNDLDVLRAACRNGLMPGVTYSFSPTGRYNGRRIAHMVNCVHATDDWFAVLDNNYVGSFEWMNQKEFLATFSGGQQGWAIILLTKAPPPTPRG